MTIASRAWRTRFRSTIAGVVWSLLFSGSAWAQTAGGPNSGALTFTGGFDVLPGVPYVFRGIVQESDPELTLWPHADLGIELFAGDGVLSGAGINFGVWNSLQTGSSGLGGPTRRLHYEERFYSTLALTFGSDLSLGTTFTAYSSPNGMFTTVEELSFKLSWDDMLAPYGILALELTDDGQADVGIHKGTYLELGVGPSWRLGGAATLTVPAKLGLSIKDYYEGPLGSDTFGFFDIGALVTVPLQDAPGRFGSWNVHGGADVLFFGDTAKLFNAGDASKVVWLFGIGVTY